MNKRHWRKILRQNPDITKLMPAKVEGKRDGYPVSLPMNPSTVRKIEALKAKMGIK